MGYSDAEKAGLLGLVKDEAERMRKASRPGCECEECREARGDAPPVACYRLPKREVLLVEMTLEEAVEIETNAWTLESPIEGRFNEIVTAELARRRNEATR